MQQRRERQGVTGFATGFDVLSPDEQRKRAERAARYGASLEGGGGGKAVVGGELAGDPAGALVVDVLEPRRDALGDALVRHECVYVYGVDHLSTKECMAYFGDYAPVFVEWINDSSCNVVFADAFTAKRAMYGKARVGDARVWDGVRAPPSDAPSNPNRECLRHPRPRRRPQPPARQTQLPRRPWWRATRPLWCPVPLRRTATR